MLLAIALVISSMTAMAECEILKPNQADNNGRYCSGTNFAVTYKGFLTTDSCYPTLKEALVAKKSMPACEMRSSTGNCEILFSGRADNNGKYCSGVSFAVTYNGYIAEDTCHTSLDKAMNAMDMTLSCKKSPRNGKLSILYPGRADNNGHYCSGVAFAVTYDGYLIEDVCHTTIDKAMAAMESF